jgi:hypothetical protein
VDSIESRCVKIKSNHNPMEKTNEQRVKARIFVINKATIFKVIKKREAKNIR